MKPKRTGIDKFHSNLALLSKSISLKEAYENADPISSKDRISSSSVLRKVAGDKRAREEFGRRYPEAYKRLLETAKRGTARNAAVARALAGAGIKYNPLNFVAKNSTKNGKILFKNVFGKNPAQQVGYRVDPEGLIFFIGHSDALAIGADPKTAGRHLASPSELNIWELSGSVSWVERTGKEQGITTWHESEHAWQSLSGALGDVTSLKQPWRAAREKVEAKWDGWWNRKPSLTEKEKSDMVKDLLDYSGRRHWHEIIELVSEGARKEPRTIVAQQYSNLRAHFTKYAAPFFQVKPEKLAQIPQARAAFELIGRNERAAIKAVDANVPARTVVESMNLFGPLGMEKIMNYQTALANRRAGKK